MHTDQQKPLLDQYGADVHLLFTKIIPGKHTGTHANWTFEALTPRDHPAGEQREFMMKIRHKALPVRRKPLGHPKRDHHKAIKLKIDEFSGPIEEILQFSH